MLVDCDPQHHLSNWLDWEADGKPTTSDIIFSTVTKQNVDFKNCIRYCEKENFDFIPSINLLAGMLGIIAADDNSSTVISRIFENDYFNENYDYIIFDCQTALDLLVTNVLNACDKLLIPVQADLLSYEGVEQMLDSFMRIKKTQKFVNTYLECLLLCIRLIQDIPLQFIMHLKRVITISFLTHIYRTEQKQKLSRFSPQQRFRLQVSCRCSIHRGCT